MSDPILVHDLLFDVLNRKTLQKKTKKKKTEKGLILKPKMKTKKKGGREKIKEAFYLQH